MSYLFSRAPENEETGKLRQTWSPIVCFPRPCFVASPPRFSSATEYKCTVQLTSSPPLWCRTASKPNEQSVSTHSYLDSRLTQRLETCDVDCAFLRGEPKLDCIAVKITAENPSTQVSPWIEITQTVLSTRMNLGHPWIQVNPQWQQIPKPHPALS